MFKASKGVTLCYSRPGDESCKRFSKSLCFQEKATGVQPSFNQVPKTRVDASSCCCSEGWGFMIFKVTLDSWSPNAKKEEKARRKAINIVGNVEEVGPGPKVRPQVTRQGPQRQAESCWPGSTGREQTGGAARGPWRAASVDSCCSYWLGIRHGWSHLG